MEGDPYEDGLTHDVRTYWQRWDYRSELIIPAPDLRMHAVVLAVVEVDGRYTPTRWRWQACGTAGRCVRRGDAETLCRLRLGYGRHEGWMESIQDETWAGVETMRKIE